MNAELRAHLTDHFSINRQGGIVSVTPVSGGSINDAYKVETRNRPLFLKVNHAAQFPSMFEAEKRGLELLSTSCFCVPKPISVGRFGDRQFILMEWIEQGKPKDDFWNQFGRNLAELHQHTNDQFGLDHDNYIGSLRQSNAAHTSWADLYREERLIPQMKLVERAGLLSAKMKRGFNALFDRLETIYPIEKPALLHGDLWSGNMMVNAEGKPCVFDPAVYYGHREMDLAMMALFAGFGDSWVDGYNEIHPLENGWRDRIGIGQLYPLMVHVNLFGGGYARSVESILERYLA